MLISLIKSDREIFSNQIMENRVHMILANIVNSLTCPQGGRALGILPMELHTVKLI
jgi:hypothetical protein